MGYQEVTDALPPEFETVLTIHREDLFPVCAFRIDGVWLRVIEGPEDDIREEAGDHGMLYRAPTHFASIPLLLGAA